jgi:capsular polysaccharide biosynthesis protein
MSASSPTAAPHQRRKPAFDYLRDSDRLIAALRHGWWLILAAIAVALLMAAMLSRGQVPLYRTATTLIVVPARETKDTGDILKSLDTLERRTVVATFARIPSAPETRAAAAKSLSLDENALAGYRIEGAVVPNTNIIRIDVEGSDGKTVADVANAAAAVTNTRARALYRIYAMETLALALPSSRPIHPDGRRNYLVALVLGAFVGCAAALSWPYVSVRLRQLR